MFSEFFIHRPVFAWVIALFFMGLGAVSIFALPIQQYPTIAPPQVSISATYPGASAKTLENTVTQVIEQNLIAIDNLRYISSDSTSAGTASISVTFEPEADPDIAQVQVQNKLQQALPQLPQAVQQQGITVRKSSGSFLLVIAFFSKDGSMNRNDIADYLVSNVQEPLSRVDGVGQIRTFGSQHAMRIWLDPAKLNSYALTASDVTVAVEEQNAQVSAGQIGGAPSVKGQQINATIIAQTLLQTPEQFERILLKTLPDGSRVTIGDVARVEIGAESYEVLSRYNRQPSSGIAIELAPGANALSTIANVKARVEQFRPTFPESIDVAYPVDVAPFVKLSIEEVIKTLIEAIVLVVVVMYLFLQSGRATFIPAVAIPVVLLGTFAILLILGYTINTLTLFALVLAIGLLVDDAIVVVENVERALEEDENLSPVEATSRAMKEITGALVGTTMVLFAVFAPMAFFGGSAGVIYRQFSITVCASLALSLLVALTLSPALCATMLKGGPKKKKNRFFTGFDKGLKGTTDRYESFLGKIVNRRLLVGAVFLIFVAIAAVIFIRIPGGFLPGEDQGRMFSIVTGPANSTLERTAKTLEKLEEFYLDEAKDTVQGMFAISGFSFSGRGQNAGLAFVALKDFSEREEDGRDVDTLSQKATKAFSTIGDAQVFAIVPPAVSELGNAGGFEFNLVDQAGLGQAALTAARDQLLGMAAQNPKLTGVRPNGLPDNPQYQLDIDAAKARAMGVSLTEINQTLNTAWGGSYVNDFIENGRIKRVYVQADSPFRMLPSDIDKWYVRNDTGDMVSFADIGSGNWTFGSSKLERFNGNSSLKVQGSSAPGVSTGEAMDIVQELASKLPRGVGIEWTGISYEERQSGSQAPLLYAVSIIAVFLALAALYESWSIPFAVVLVIPLGILGAVIATTLGGQSNDIYFQIGLLLTMGLAAKNAILIVEFAKQQFEEGKDEETAALDASRMRFRPILMTSLTFVLGILPLVLASGPGSGAQNAIGYGLMGGIIAATLLVIFFAPFFFIWVYRMFPQKRHGEPQQAGHKNVEHKNNGDDKNRPQQEHEPEPFL